MAENCRYAFKILRLLHCPHIWHAYGTSAALSIACGRLCNGLGTRRTQEHPKMVLSDLCRSTLGNPGATPDSPQTDTDFMCRLILPECLPGTFQAVPGLLPG